MADSELLLEKCEFKTNRLAKVLSGKFIELRIASQMHSEHPKIRTANAL